MPGNLGDLELCWRADLQRLDRGAAAALLRASLQNGDPRSLRRLLGQALSAAAVDQLDDSAVVEQVAVRIETGELVAFRRRRAPGVWTERVSTPPPPAVAPTLAAARQTTWIEIQLVDMEDDPVPGERYRITLPDGAVKEGRLNYLGRAKVDGIENPGACSITFPDLDAEAWQPR